MSTDTLHRVDYVVTAIVRELARLRDADRKPTALFVDSITYKQLLDNPDLSWMTVGLDGSRPRFRGVEAFRVDFGEFRYVIASEPV
jgi:hypothetical protein